MKWLIVLSFLLPAPVLGCATTGTCKGAPVFGCAGDTHEVCQTRDDGCYECTCVPDGNAYDGLKPSRRF